MKTLDEIAAQVNDLLPLLGVKLIRFVRDLPDPELSVAQAFLLHNLHRQGPCTASEIGEMMCVTSGPVTNLTKRLIARGLVERHRDERDGRVMWFRLTSEGEETAKRLEEYGRSRWRIVAAELGAERASDALQLMEETIRVLNRVK